MNKCKTLQDDLDEAMDKLHDLMILSSYGGKEVHYADGWKIKTWIRAKDLDKIRKTKGVKHDEI